MPETPLRAAHEIAGARFTDFGGWTMPLRYEGVIAEHMAVRNAVGVFDVSHLGRFAVTGGGGLDLLRRMLCNDVATVAPGRAQYTMALNEAGGVDDDIIVWWLDETTWWVMPNGVNFDGIVHRFRAAAGTGVDVEPVRDGTVLLAVQGPGAPEVVAAVLGSVPGRSRVTAGTFAGGWVVAAGTGYTGESGAEIAVPAETGGDLWDAILEAGAAPCGLGARDTLRLEMGYPLWGQDLDERTSPLEAGLGWVVAWDHEFVGRDALGAQRERGPDKRLVGFVAPGRQVPRHGYPLRSGASNGAVTSGNFSPVLERGIGMGYVTPPIAAGDAVEVEIRGAWQDVEVVEPPFVKR
jgi:aminomethyltransferase